MVQCAFMLHNLLVRNWMDSLSEEEVTEMMRKEHNMPVWRDVTGLAGRQTEEAYIRREHLVEEMLGLVDEMPDLDRYVI